MHPVQARHAAGLHTSKRVLLLNTAVIWLDGLRENPNRIRGPTGTVVLPSELWMRVLHFVDGVTPTFVAVTVEDSAPAEDGAQRVALLERRLDRYTDIEGLIQIGRFEEFLKHPPAAAPPVPAPPGEDVLHDKEEYDEEDYDGNYVKLSFTLSDITFPEARTFSAVIPNKYSQDRLRARTTLDLLPVGVALFLGVDFTDCHARLGWDVRDGCSMCHGSRYICPGCTRGRAQRYEAFMGCGVDLACPVCSPASAFESNVLTPTRSAV
jgi:hypothetical protein